LRFQDDEPSDRVVGPELLNLDGLNLLGGRHRTLVVVGVLDGRGGAGQLVVVVVLLGGDMERRNDAVDEAGALNESVIGGPGEKLWHSEGWDV
jgi:hypothetical protein